MAFQYAKWVFTQMRYMKKTFKRLKGCLVPGRYVLLPNLRAMVLDRPESWVQGRRYFSNGNLSRKWRIFLSVANSLFFFSKAPLYDVEQYEAIYTSNNHDQLREVKLFSFAHGQILTICASEYDCNKQLSDYELLHSHFSMPLVKKQDTYPNAYKIAMVTLLERLPDKAALECIVTCHLSYFRGSVGQSRWTSVPEILAFAYSDIKMQTMLKDLSEYISDQALDLKIPLRFQHGDLSRENLLYGYCEGKEDFWWIDWEHGADRMFFYDYFFYMLNTAVYFADASALDAYLAGAYIGHLQRFFDGAGMPFDPQLLRDYFLIYSIAFLRERVCDRGNIKAMEMYHDFILEKVLK